VALTSLGIAMARIEYCPNIVFSQNAICMSVSLSVHLSVCLFLHTLPHFSVGILINAQQKLVHLCMLNSSWERREGEGKQHFHQIMGKLEDQICPKSEFSVHLSSLFIYMSIYQKLSVQIRDQSSRGWDTGREEGVGNEFRGGVLYLY
jgi:hypothetical protein